VDISCHGERWKQQMEEAGSITLCVIFCHSIASLIAKGGKAVGYIELPKAELARIFIYFRLFVRDSAY